MSEKKQVVAAGPPNPLDVVPEKISFDVPYGPPISLERAQAAINAVLASEVHLKSGGSRSLQTRWLLFFGFNDLHRYS
jgi:hypothetical protein